MRLILLPGMDGTGILFDRLLAQLNIPYTVIRLPLGPLQSYAYLEQEICAQLPKEDCILLAESFAGPIAAHIARLNLPQVKALVFIATFLSPPLPILLFIARFIPLKILLRLPLAGYFVRCLLIGQEYPLARFLTALNEVPSAVIRARLTEVSHLKLRPSARDVNIPALYLCARSDFLVAKKHAQDFKDHFPSLTVCTIDGTHFLAQSNPIGCAQKINAFIARVVNKPD